MNRNVTESQLTTRQIATKLDFQVRILPSKDAGIDCLQKETRTFIFDILVKEILTDVARQIAQILGLKKWRCTDEADVRVVSGFIEGSYGVEPRAQGIVLTNNLNFCAKVSFDESAVNPAQAFFVGRHVIAGDITEGIVESLDFKRMQSLLKASSKGKVLSFPKGRAPRK